MLVTAALPARRQRPIKLKCGQGALAATRCAGGCDSIMADHQQPLSRCDVARLIQAWSDAFAGVATASPGHILDAANAHFKTKPTGRQLGMWLGENFIRKAP